MKLVVLIGGLASLVLSGWLGLRVTARRMVPLAHAVTNQPSCHYPVTYRLETPGRGATRAARGAGQATQQIFEPMDSSNGLDPGAES